MHNMTALWDAEAPEDEVVRTYQYLINTGQAWRLEGHVGRTAMDLLKQGRCALGLQPYTDYYGGRIPSRHEVKAGSMGSLEYVSKKGYTIMEDANA